MEVLLVKVLVEVGCPQHGPIQRRGAHGVLGHAQITSKHGVAVYISAVPGLQSQTQHADGRSRCDEITHRAGHCGGHGSRRCPSEASKNAVTRAVRASRRAVVADCGRLIQW